MGEYQIPDDLRYTEQDEWVRDEGGRLLVGVTDYAQQQLGDIVFIELPEIGTRVDKGNAFGVIESVKTVSDLCAPLGGEVVARNDELADRPEMVNEDCYGDGWIIAISSDEGVDPLLDADAYRRHVEERGG